MCIIGINEIINLNKLLEDKNAKVHLRDACGKQSLWIEALNSALLADGVYETINSFFSQKKVKLIYADDKINFWID